MKFTLTLKVYNGTSKSCDLGIGVLSSKSTVAQKNGLYTLMMAE